MSAILSIKGLCAEISGSQALTDINLELEEGMILGVIGPNGAGKTTLLRSILNLLPNRKGKIAICGRDVTRLPTHELTPYVSYMPQGSVAHWPLSVEDMVSLSSHGLANRWFSPERPGIMPSVEQALKATKMEPLRDRCIDDLSGGERARAFLARSLASEAPLLLVDEPFASLDPFHQLEMMEIFQEEAKNGRTTIMVLHDLNLARAFCDRLCVLKDGKLCSFGRPAQVLNAELIKSVYNVAAQVNPSGYIQIYNSE